MAKKNAEPVEDGPRGDIQGEPGHGDPNVQAAAAAYNPGPDPDADPNANGEVHEREITDQVAGGDNV